MTVGRVITSGRRECREKIAVFKTSSVRKASLSGRICRL